MSTPGGIIAIAPGGVLCNPGRAGVLEIKTCPDHLVFAAERDTRLLRGGASASISEWHLTVHRDLATHARSADRRQVIPLRGAHRPERTATALFSAATAPERDHVAAKRSQRSWGPSIIVSPVADSLYDPARTVLVLDVWAVSPHRGPLRLPSLRPGARPASDNSGRLSLGPCDAAHAFLAGSAPQAAFYYVLWWAAAVSRYPTVFANETTIGLGFLGLLS